ncbi:MAG: SulP family inorganic anion transporter, partial [Planctomycetota bacterium]
MGGFAARPLEILRDYRRAYVRADLIAGLTVAAVAIPQAIAYASVAELPAHYGLYTAAVGAIVGALWGSSRFLSTGPVNASSLLVLTVLLTVAASGTPEFLMAAGLLAVMAGVMRIVLALMRFGALVTLASR